MERTKVKLRICDIDCTITSDNNEEYVRTLGGEIDRAISAVLKKNDRISLSMAAIITAMTYCDESAKAKAELAELKSLEKHAESEVDHLKQDAELARKQAEQLRSELQMLHACLTDDNHAEQPPEIKESIQSSVNTEAADSEQEVVFRCINGNPAYVPKQQSKNQEQLYHTTEQKSVSVEDALTLEELRDSIQSSEEPDQSLDKSLERPTVTATAAQKHNKQSRLHKKQQKRAQKPKEKEGSRHIPPYSPVQRAEQPVPEVLKGDFSRPKSPFEPELPSNDTFISYFEKK